MTILRYMKTSLGAGRGESWPEARGLSSLGDDLRSAKAGDRFLVGFDRDREAPVFWAGNPLRIATGGNAEAPILLKFGYVGHSKDVVIARSPGGGMFFRSPHISYRRSLPKLSGPRLIDLDGGASHVEINGFRGLGFSADGVIKFRAGKGEIPKIVVRNLGCMRVGRVLESMKGSVVAGLTVENCDAHEVVRGFARFRTLRDAVFRNLTLSAGSVDGGKAQICELISIVEGANILFEDLTLCGTDNMLGRDGGEYGDWYVQGDGLSVERDVRDIKIRNCHGSGFGDSAFDLKAQGVTIQDSSATDCKFGVRLWAPRHNLIQRSHFRNPRSVGGAAGACLQTKGQVMLVDSHLQAGPRGALFSLEGEGSGNDRHVVMQGGSISLDQDGRFVIGTGAGRIELRDVAVNGEIRNEVVTHAGQR